MPSETTINRNTILSKESHRGSFSYICLEKVFLKYPNYKGYLFINDDDFMKIWELDTFINYLVIYESEKNTFIYYL